MYKNLSSGVKISISRSISTAFEQYMNSIGWDENKADIEMFVKEWKEYAEKNASWYEKIDAEIEPQIGVIPSYTSLGMASLLPNESIEISDNYSDLVTLKIHG